MVSQRDRERRRNAYRNRALKSAFAASDEGNRAIQTAQLRVLIDIHEQLDDLRDEVARLAKKK